MWRFRYRGKNWEWVFLLAGAYKIRGWQVSYRWKLQGNQIFTLSKEEKLMDTSYQALSQKLIWLHLQNDVHLAKLKGNFRWFYRKKFHDEYQFFLQLWETRWLKKKDTSHVSQKGTSRFLGLDFDTVESATVSDHDVLHVVRIVRLALICGLASREKCNRFRSCSKKRKHNNSESS